MQGQFQRYYARCKFYLGPLDLTVKVGQLVEFDGTSVRVEGKVACCPVLQKAIDSEGSEGRERIARVFEHFFGYFDDGPWLASEKSLLTD